MTANGSPATPRPSRSPIVSERCLRRWNRNVQLHECPAGRAAESNTAGKARRKSDDDTRRPANRTYAWYRSAQRTLIGDEPRRYVTRCSFWDTISDVPRLGLSNRYPTGSARLALATNSSSSTPKSSPAATLVRLAIQPDSPRERKIEAAARRGEAERRRGWPRWSSVCRQSVPQPYDGVAGLSRPAEPRRVPLRATTSVAPTNVFRAPRFGARRTPLSRVR